MFDVLIAGGDVDDGTPVQPGAEPARAADRPMTIMLQRRRRGVGPGISLTIGAKTYGNFLD